MLMREANQLAPGLYRIYWRTGGSSLAAVGVTSEGNRWMAPINWVYPGDSYSSWWLVTKVEKLEVKGAHVA